MVVAAPQLDVAAAISANGSWLENEYSAPLHAEGDKVLCKVADILRNNIRKNDIAEIISGPFKREKAKVVRVDPAKEEVIVELLEAVVSIPITLKMDAVKVIRREDEAQ